MITTLTGANDFLRKRELGKLVRGFVAEHGDLALERLDGEEASAARMRDALQSLPFLSPRKMVVLYTPGKQKAWADHIGDTLKDVPETTDVIIVEPKLDKRLSYYKTLKKETDFREFGELDAGGLAQWAAAYAKEQGGTLSAADARLLIDRVGPNQQLLASEIDKLLAYNPAVTRQSIELLTDPMPQSTVFELLDAAFSGNTKRALELYQEQRALKVEPQAIIAMLAWQLHVLATVKSAGSRATDDIAKTAKLNPYVVRKTQNLARNLALEQIKQMVANLLKIDRQLKTTPTNPDEALQLYLLKLANR
jgi:DNA polymerase-3 subunit delta